MKYRKLGKSDIELSVVALGAWAIGGGTWWGDSDDNQSINAIHAAIDNGVNLIDTAPVYGFGHSESVVGKAIKGKRDKVFIATKCGLWWQNNTGTFHFNLDGKTINRSLAPATIVKELEMSLKRMQIDYIDLYQTHWPSNEPEKYTISDTMECLMKLKEQGKIRSRS